MVFHGFWLVSMVFQVSFVVAYCFLLVSMVFQGGFIVFMVFGWFPLFFKVVSWFFMVFVWFPWFSRWFHVFSRFLISFHGFSRWFQWFFMVFHGFWLVSIVFLVENTTKLYPGPTIQSRPCRPQAGFGPVVLKYCIGISWFIPHCFIDKSLIPYKKYNRK